MNQLKDEYSELIKRIKSIENIEKYEEIWGINPQENKDFKLIKFEMDTKIKKLLEEISQEKDEMIKSFKTNDCKASIDKVKELLDKYGWK